MKSLQTRNEKKTEIEANADAAITFSPEAAAVVRANAPDLFVVELARPSEIYALPIEAGVENLLVVLDNTPAHLDVFARFLRRMAHSGINVVGRCPQKAKASWASVVAELGEDCLVEGGDWVDNDRLLAQTSLAHIKKLRGSPDIEDAILYFNSQYFVAGIGGQTMVVHEVFDPQLSMVVLKHFAPSEFFNRYKDWYIALGKRDPACAALLWFSSARRRQFEDIFFDPTQNPEWEHRYNLFRGFPFQPIEGDSSGFWTHVREVICCGDKAKFAFIRRWMAQLFQAPEVKPATYIVLQGLQGTGKTLFANVLLRLLGEYGCKVDTVSRLTSRFNSPLAHALLAYVDELRCDKYNQREVMERLKSLTGSPTTNIEFKGKEPVTLVNFARVMMSSNEAEPLPLTGDNRRAWLFRLSAERCNDHAYFGRFQQKTAKPQVCSAIMYDLMTESLDGFNPDQPPCGNETFATALGHSSAIVRWLHEQLKANAPDSIFRQFTPDARPKIPVGQFKAALKQWCEQGDIRMDFPSSLKELRQVLPSLDDYRPAAPGNPLHATVRRDRAYDFPSLHESRKDFCAWFKLTNHDWDAD